jgi:hypothetical protein
MWIYGKTCNQTHCRGFEPTAFCSGGRRSDHFEGSRHYLCDLELHPYDWNVLTYAIKNDFELLISEMFVFRNEKLLFDACDPIWRNYVKLTF